MKQFNSEQVINIIQSVGKIGGSTLATYGVQAQNVWASWVGFVVAAVALWFSHHSAATPSPGAPASTSADNTGKLPPIALCAFLALAIGWSGCASSGSSRVTAGIWNDGMGYKRINTSTNGILTTNSFHLHFPVPLTNLPTVIEGLGVGAF